MILKSLKIFTLLIFSLCVSCKKNDRVYESKNKEEVEEQTKSNIVDDFKLLRFEVEGLSILTATEPKLLKEGIDKKALNSAMYKTEITEDKSVLGYAWGVVITHITYEEQKYPNLDSLEQALKIREEPPKGATDFEFKSGIYSVGSIKGRSMDTKTNLSGIKGDQTTVIFTNKNDFWQIQIIGIGVSKQPNHKLFEQLKDEILSSIKIQNK